ncbi:MAG: chemotaxis protein CheW [Desulfuromonadia bacterium]
MTHQSLQELQIACFRLGMDLYAVDIMRIKEIIKPQKISGLPRAPRFVEGVINLRGMVIPVVDLRTRFGIPVAAESPLTRFLIVKAAAQLLALIVDDVIEVVTVDPREIKAPPQLKRGEDESLIGVCLVNGEMVLLLDIDAILSGDETSQLREGIAHVWNDHGDGITHA